MASLRLFATRHATVSLRTLPVLPAVTTRAPLPRYFASAAMSSSRLIDEIKIDHDNIRDLLSRFKQAHSKKDEQLCTDIANTIVHEAAIHSDGEELSIYKLMDQHGMSQAAEHDREEHQQVKQAMADIDSHSIKDLGLDEYAKRVVDACQLFISHAKEEEDDHLPRLVKAISEHDQTQAVKDFLKGRKMAPTRPHPSAPQSGGIAQQAVGAVGKAADMVMDQGRNFVDLKHHHEDVSLTS